MTYIPNTTPKTNDPHALEYWQNVQRSEQPPIPGTLLAAFQRFADLSCYWHRHGTPDSLALSELQERNRLAIDLPELIKRLTAFASLNTEPRFEAEARVVVEPPRDDQGTTPPAAEYRMLEAGELIQPGDEWLCDDAWLPVRYISEPLCTENVGHCRRKVVSNDTAGQCAEDTGECPDCGGLLKRTARGVSCLACDRTWDGQGKRDHEAASGQSGASEDGWRFIQAGEAISQGDEWGGISGADWQPASMGVIGMIQKRENRFFRRRIPAKEQP